MTSSNSSISRNSTGQERLDEFISQGGVVSQSKSQNKE